MTLEGIYNDICGMKKIEKKNGKNFKLTHIHRSQSLIVSFICRYIIKRFKFSSSISQNFEKKMVNAAGTFVKLFVKLYQNL